MAAIKSSPSPLRQISRKNVPRPRMNLPKTKKLDEEWAAAQTLQDKLANEQKFTQHAYRVAATRLMLYEKRSELIKDEEKGLLHRPAGSADPVPEPAASRIAS